MSMAAAALIALPMAHVTVPGERMTLRRTLGLVIGFAGVLVLGEALPPSLFAAMTLILGGVGHSQYGALKRLFERK